MGIIGIYNYTIILTFIGVASAITGMTFALSGHPARAILCLLICGVCDMFDGKIARTRKRTRFEESYGIQLDSLCDVVCFGVLPAIIGYSIGLSKWYCIPILVFYVLAAITRLAFFNVQEELRKAEGKSVKRTYYTGLPVTNSAIIFAFVYGLRLIIGESIYLVVYAVALILVALAFIAKVRVVKVGPRGLAVLFAIGVVELILMLCLK